MQISSQRRHYDPTGYVCSILAERHFVNKYKRWIQLDLKIVFLEQIRQRQSCKGIAAVLLWHPDPALQVRGGGGHSTAPLSAQKAIGIALPVMNYTLR